MQKILVTMMALALTIGAQAQQYDGNTTYEVNAQGRTETWFRVIPNYVMLRVAWQFNRSPKK